MSGRYFLSLSQSGRFGIMGDSKRYPGWMEIESYAFEVGHVGEAGQGKFKSRSVRLTRLASQLSPFIF